MSRMRTILGNGSPATNEAEGLIDLARIANQMIRKGASINEVCDLMQCSADRCKLALAFFQANDAVKLRALVEDWPLAEIERECSCELNCPLSPDRRFPPGFARLSGERGPKG